VISRPWSRDSSALEFILSRSRSRDQKSKVSVLVSRPEDLKKVLTTTLIMSLICNTADKIQIQGKKKGTQNTKHNDENSLKLKLACPNRVATSRLTDRTEADQPDSAGFAA